MWKDLFDLGSSFQQEYIALGFMIGPVVRDFFSLVDEIY